MRKNIFQFVNIFGIIWTPSVCSVRESKEEKEHQSTRSSHPINRE